MEEEMQAVVPAGSDGERLDQALALVLPESGLRERKRLVERGRVLVDGRMRAKGYRVRAGQTLAVLPADEVEEAVCSGVRVMAEAEEYWVVAKPAGLHTEAVRGSGEPSLQACLAEMLPGAILLSRLDRSTAGLVAAAKNQGAALDWRSMEDAGEVRKHYWALVRGEMREPMLLDGELDTANRKRTKVLPYPAFDPLRRTEARPVRYFPDRDATLVEAVILKGARHQIRAHLAEAGHPIVGDGLYGPEPGPTLYLHHYRLDAPFIVAELAPGWPDIEIPEE